MTNARIHKFEVDQLTDNIKSATFLREDGTLQTLNSDNVTISASFTENGTYTPPEGTVGFDSVEINVPPSGKLETVTVVLDDEAQTIRPSIGFDGIGEVRVPKSNLRSLAVDLSPNSKTYYSADDGFFGFSSISVPGYNTLLTDIDVQDLTDAGYGLGLTRTITPQMIFGDDTEIKGFSSFQLPPAILQSKQVTLSTSEQTIQPTDGAYGLSEVTVPSVYEVFTDDWTITQNGDNQVPPSPYLGAGKVNVHVQPVLRDYTFTSNGGPYTAGAGYDGWGTINVNVPPPPDPHVVEANKNVTITSNGTDIQVTPDVGYNVMSKVTLDVAVPVPSIQTSKTVTLTQNNDSVDIAPDVGYDALANVHVNVQVPATGNVQTSKSVTYTQNGVYTVRADTGYDSVEQVNVTVNTMGINLSPQGVFAGGSFGVEIMPGAFVFTDRQFTTKTTFSSSDIGTSVYGVWAVGMAYPNIGFNDDPYMSSYQRGTPTIDAVFPIGTSASTIQTWLSAQQSELASITGISFDDSYEGAYGLATNRYEEEEHGTLLIPLVFIGIKNTQNSTYYYAWCQEWDENYLGEYDFQFTPYCFATYGQYS